MTRGIRNNNRHSGMAFAPGGRFFLAHFAVGGDEQDGEVRLSSSFEFFEC